MTTIEVDRMPSRRVLTLDAAHLLVQAAIKAAAAKDINYLVVAVVDEGGYLLALSRQDGTEKAAVEIGIAKARTAAITRKPTQWWTDQLHGGVLAFLVMPGVTPVGGAHPIVISDQVVGEISTAGGSFEVDDEICRAALSLLT